MITVNENPKSCSSVVVNPLSDLSEDVEFKTAGRVTEVSVPKNVHELYKNQKDIIDHVFLEKVLKKAQERFDEAMSFAKESQEPELQKALEEARKETLKTDPKNPRVEIRKLLSLFPGIRDDLIKEDEANRALICQYEVWKHREHFIKKFTKVLGVIGTIGGLAGVGAAAILSIPLIPAALYTLAGLKVATGGLKIRNSIAHREELAAGKAAKLMIEVHKGMEEELKDLKDLKKDLGKIKNPDADQQAEISDINQRIIKLNTALTSSEKQFSELASAVKDRKNNIKNLVSGIASTTFGSLALLGGLYATDRLSDFEADPSSTTTIPLPTSSPGDVIGGGGVIDTDP